MARVWYIVPLLLATVALADYYIDNADASVIYSVPSNQSGMTWQTFSVDTEPLMLNISNSTGDYSIPIDPSQCYDQNYALGVCGTTDNCFVQIPFTGSGITIYVFNAGLSGMSANFSVDSGTPVSNSTQAPPPPTYQVSNVSLYSIQGLPTGNHSIQMTLLDWNGTPTSMKFDYAYVNETFVASPGISPVTTTGVFTMSQFSVQTQNHISFLTPIWTPSQTPAQTSSQQPTHTSAGNAMVSNKVDVGPIVGGTLGGLALLTGFVIGFFYLRKPTAAHRIASPEPIVHGEHSISELDGFASLLAMYAQQGLSSQLQRTPSVRPLERSTAPSSASAAGNRWDQTQSIMSGRSSTAIQPLPEHNLSIDSHARSSASRVRDTRSSHIDPQIAARYHLTTEQVEIIDRLRLASAPPDSIAYIIEGFVSSNMLNGAVRSPRHRYQMRDG